MCDAHPVQYQGQRSTHGEPDSHVNTCVSKWHIYFLLRMHRKQRHETYPGWHCCFSVSHWKGEKTGAHTGSSSSSKQTKPHDKRLRLSRAASFFAPLQQEAAAAAAAAATHWSESPPTENLKKKKKGPDLTCVRRSRGSHLPSLLWICLRGGCWVLWWAPLCVFQRHVINAQRRTVRSRALHPGC